MNYYAKTTLKYAVIAALLILLVIVFLAGCKKDSDSSSFSPYADNWCWAYVGSEMLDSTGYEDYTQALDVFQATFPNKPKYLGDALRWWFGSGDNFTVYRALPKLSNEDNKARFYRIMKEATAAGRAIGIMIDVKKSTVEHYVLPWELSKDHTILEVVTLQPAQV